MKPRVRLSGGHRLAVLLLCRPFFADAMEKVDTNKSHSASFNSFFFLNYSSVGISRPHHVNPLCKTGTYHHHPFPVKYASCHPKTFKNRHKAITHLPPLCRAHKYLSFLNEFNESTNSCHGTEREKKYKASNMCRKSPNPLSAGRQTRTHTSSVQLLPC